MDQPFHGRITYVGRTPIFARVPTPERMPEPSPGNLSPTHIHHPRLGQVETQGNRFAAILDVSNALHRQQLGNGERWEDRQRQLGRSLASYFSAKG